MYGNQSADDVFSTRDLLARLRERGIHATDIASAIRTVDQDSAALEESFASFGTDLGTFLKPFVSDFRADVVLVTRGIAEVWDRFSPSLNRSLSVPVLRGTLGKRAALLGVALFISRCCNSPTRATLLIRVRPARSLKQIDYSLVYRYNQIAN